MSEVVEIRVSGLTEINARLKELGPAGKKAARRALLRGTKMIRDDATERAPLGKTEKRGLEKLKSGHLKRNIQGTVKETNAGFKGTIRVRPKIYWDRFVERGTRPHNVSKGANRSSGRRQSGNRGHPGTQAQPFMEPAFKANVNQAFELMVKELQRSLFG